MDKLTNLLKEHLVGEWCKRAAWIIAAIGLIEIVLNVYNVILNSQLINIGYPSNWELSRVPVFIIPIFIDIAQTIFFFFVLYAAGTFLNNFLTDTEEDADELIAEEEEDLEPGQFTEIE